MITREVIVPPVDLDGRFTADSFGGPEVGTLAE
jgi:hypothetical protein